jgi:hypothetical protein
VRWRGWRSRLFNSFAEIHTGIAQSEHDMKHYVIYFVDEDEPARRANHRDLTMLLDNPEIEIRDLATAPTLQPTVSIVVCIAMRPTPKWK